MGRSAKDRSAKYRQNLKADTDRWKSVKEAERLRLQRVRAAEKTKGDDAGAKHRRELGRLRALKYRKKKRVGKVATLSPEVNVLGTYSSHRQLARASNKIYKHLPRSPGKRRAVLAKIVKESCGPVLFKKKKKARGRASIDKEYSKKVVAFYNRDDISWQTPGKRDTISVKDPVTGKRSLKQKRYLTMNIGEAKSIFDEENGGSQISLSAFYKLRPKEVIPLSKTPHNVCVCVTHANFFFLVDALLPSLLGVTSYETLMAEAVCDKSKEECMLEKCKVCQEFNVRCLLNLAAADTELIPVKKWVKERGRLQVIKTFEPIKDVIQTFNETFPAFKAHSFVKNAQSKHFESKKKTLKKDEGVIQVDFAENASLLAQDEIQSAHWCHGQVTLFTCVIWTAEKSYSYVVISDDLTHSKDSVWVFLKAIMNDLKQSHSETLELIDLFTDNCAAQFRSKFTVGNLCHLAQDLDVKSVTLDTFAAGHGKGAVDGIGGLVKRQVWLSVKARRVI